MTYRLLLCLIVLFGTAGSAVAAAPAAENNEAIESSKRLLNEKKYAETIELLRQAIDRAPLKAALHLWLGNAYWSICDYRAAIKEFDTAEKLDTKDQADQKDVTSTVAADAWAHKGVCLARLGFYDEAVEAFRQSARRKTADATVTLLVSRALLEHKDYQAVLDYLKGFDDTNVKQVNVLDNINLAKAQAEAALNHIDVAQGILDGTLAASPDFQLGYLARARLKQKQHQYEAAMLDARKAIELRKGKWPQAHLLNAECYLASGKVGEAEVEVLTAQQEFNNEASGELLFYKAMVAEKKGNFIGSLPGKAQALQLGYVDPPSLIVVGKEALSVDKIFNNFSAVVPGDHFICFGDFSRDRLDHYSKIAEGFAAYTAANLCPLQGNYPAFLFMLQDKATEQHFLHNRMAFAERVHGVFMSGSNAVTTYDGAGVGTFLHEISHKFLYTARDHDFWADEGVAAFFEKAYGYLADVDGKPALVLKLGYPEVEKKLWPKIKAHKLKISDIVKSARYADPTNEDAQRLVALFLYEQGKLKNFLDLTYKNKKGQYQYFIEAAFDKPLGELDPLFDAYTAKLEQERETINRLPPSEIFASKEQFNDFIKRHDL